VSSCAYAAIQRTYKAAFMRATKLERSTGKQQADGVAVKNALRVLLTVEVLACFAPAMVAVFLNAFVYVMPLLHDAPDHGWTPHIQMVGYLLVCAAAVVAAFLMLSFILDGKRAIPRPLMFVLVAAGLLLAGAATFQMLKDGAPLLLLILPGAPFLCGLHLLFLGRRYFTREAPT